MVTVGCAKKPKLRLENLQTSPAGSAYDGAGLSGDGYVPESFATAGLTPLDGLGDKDGGGKDAVGGGAWGSLDSPVVDANAGSFVKDGSYWNDKVYFDYNRSEVRSSERPKLEALAGHLQNNPGLAVVIEGHCDERGSDEYNRALSERRSLAVRDYLVTLGVTAERMRTVSYGEDRPVVADAVTEADHQLNRRAEFLIGNR
ncbi:MAG: OmpA family protein [Lentisphaerae bacterium]|nr:OmpA family protein [Lentisphaerota bacterium]